MKKLLMLAAIVAAYATAAFVNGQLVAAKMDRALAEMQVLLPTLKVTQDQRHLGVFSSTRSTTFDFGSFFDAEKCTQPDQHHSQSNAAAAAADPLLLTIKQTISHGPLLGFGLPAVAKVRFEILVNDQPLSERFGAELHGEMPQWVARYGFTGGTDLSGSAGEGGLVFKDDKGKPLAGLAWSSFAIKGSSNAGNTQFNYEGKLPELAASLTDVSGKQVHLVLKDLSLKADRERPYADQWLVYTGSDQLHFGSLDVEMDGKPLAQLLDAKADGKAVLAKGLMDSSELISLAVVKAGGEIIGPVHYDFSLLHLDPIAMGQLMNVIMQNSNGACHSAEQNQKLLTNMKGVLPALLKGNPEIHMDRLSVGYGGEEAVISGILRLPGVTAADLEQPAALVAKLEAVATFSVPEQLINKLAMKAAQKQLESTRQGQAAAASPAEQLAQAKIVAEGMMQQQVQLALANNWLVRQDQNLVGKFEFRLGKALLNGAPFKRPDGQ